MEHLRHQVLELHPLVCLHPLYNCRVYRVGPVLHHFLLLAAGTFFVESWDRQVKAILVALESLVEEELLVRGRLGNTDLARFVDLHLLG